MFAEQFCCGGIVVPGNESHGPCSAARKPPAAHTSARMDEPDAHGRHNFMAREEQRGSMFWVQQWFAVKSRRSRLPRRAPRRTRPRPGTAAAFSLGHAWTPLDASDTFSRDELGRSGGHISRLSDQSDRSPPRKLSAAHPTDDNDHHGLPAINTKIKLLLLLCGRRVRRPSVKPLAPLSSELPGIARLGN
jgi:hypothetical protein